MSISLCFTPLTSHPRTHRKVPIFKPLKPVTFTPIPLEKRNSLPVIKCIGEYSGKLQPLSVNSEKPSWENVLSILASLYPLYVTVGGIVACVRPSTFVWFVEKGPASYSLSLGFIMLAMGLTLELKDLINLFMQRPLSILYGCAAQYTIMPASGWIISKVLGLPPSISVGLILLACCPGGTASNVVTLIAKGDVPLSIVMTICTTLGAVLLTPLLTKILAGTYVPVDAIKLSISTLQVVVAPILLGSSMQSVFPGAVKSITPFAPLLAVLASSLLACRFYLQIFDVDVNFFATYFLATYGGTSLFLGGIYTCICSNSWSLFVSVFSENIIHLKSSVVGASLFSDLPILTRAQALLSSELRIVILSVLLLHFAGFFVGYLSAAFGGFGEPQRRAMSIEVGMQNSSLGVVLATSHFSSPMIALPPAMSAVIMNIMGSSLGFFWRYINPSDSKEKLAKDDN